MNVQKQFSYNKNRSLTNLNEIHTQPERNLGIIQQEETHQEIIPDSIHILDTQSDPELEQNKSNRWIHFRESQNWLENPETDEIVVNKNQDCELNHVWLEKNPFRIIKSHQTTNEIDDKKSLDEDHLYSKSLCENIKDESSLIPGETPQEQNYFSDYVKNQQNKFKTENVNKHIKNIKANYQKNKSVLTNQRIHVLKNINVSNNLEVKNLGISIKSKQIVKGCEIFTEKRETKNISKQHSAKLIAPSNKEAKCRNQIDSSGCFGKITSPNQFTNIKLCNPGFKDFLPFGKNSFEREPKSLNTRKSFHKKKSICTSKGIAIYEHKNLFSEQNHKKINELDTILVDVPPETAVLFNNADSSFRDFKVSKPKEFNSQHRQNGFCQPSFTKKKSSTNFIIPYFEIPETNDGEIESERKKQVKLADNKLNNFNPKRFCKEQKNLIKENLTKMKHIVSTKAESKLPNPKSTHLRIELELLNNNDIPRPSVKMLTPQSNKNLKNALSKNNFTKNEMNNKPSREFDFHKKNINSFQTHTKKIKTQIKDLEIGKLLDKEKIQTTKSKAHPDKDITQIKLNDLKKNNFRGFNDSIKDHFRQNTKNQISTPKYSFNNFISAKSSPSSKAEKHFVFKGLPSPTITRQPPGDSNKKDSTLSNKNAKFEFNEFRAITEEGSPPNKEFSKHVLCHNATFESVHPKHHAKVSSFAPSITNETFHIDQNGNELYFSGLEERSACFREETLSHIRRHSVQINETHFIKNPESANLKKKITSETDEFSKPNVNQSEASASKDDLKMEFAHQTEKQTRQWTEKTKEVQNFKKMDPISKKNAFKRLSDDNNDIGAYKETQFNHVFKIMNLLDNDEKLNDKRKMIREKMQHIKNKVNTVENMQKGQNTLKSDEEEFLRGFILREIIGEGSYALVKLALNINQPSKLFAIKIYKNKTLEDPLKQTNLDNEIKILELTNHPSIIKFHSSVKACKHHFIIMDFFSKISLQEFLEERQGSVSEEIIRPVLFQLSSAIQYLHQLNIIHRDIKLQNILIQNNLKIKLIDFGFSVKETSEAKLNVFCGTPSYMAPEIVKRIPYDGKKTDVWALGVVIFKMLTGLFPFRANTETDLYNKIKAGNVKYPETISHELRDLLSKIFVIKPEERISSLSIVKHKWFSFDFSKMTATTVCQNDLKSVSEYTKVE